MAAHDEQIGQRAGYEQAMQVLRQSAIAHFGKAKHTLDDPDRMFDPGPHFGFGAVFGPLDFIANTTVTVAAICEILGLGRMLLDHRPLAAIRLVTFAPTELKVQLTPRPVSRAQKGRSHRPISAHDADTVALIGSSRPRWQ